MLHLYIGNRLADDIQCPSRPLFFIGHSLGGIAIKEVRSLLQLSFNCLHSLELLAVFLITLSFSSLISSNHCLSEAFRLFTMGTEIGAIMQADN